MKKPLLFLLLIVTALLNFKALQGLQFVPIGKRCTISKKFHSYESRLGYVDSKTPTIDTSDFDEVSAKNPGLKKPSKTNIVKAPLKLGVLLLNLGGPETMDDVEGFLYNLFADPDIIRLPSFFSFLQKPIAYFIAKRRAPKSSAAYLSIGGGSPIVKYTKAQADLIQLSLRKKGLRDAKCYFAMRYWNPYTEEVLEQMRNDGINSMVILPLYPQYSISTSGSSLKLLSDIFYNEPDKWGPDKVTHTVVPAWYYRPGYVKTMASMIVEELRAFSPAEMAKGLHVLFSAHGVPESYIEAGDPYQRHIEECVRLISKEVSNQLSCDSARPLSMSKEIGLQLAGALTGTANVDGGGAIPAQFHLSFQSRVGPVQWLKPYTEETLVELGASGVKNLVVVPVSFVSEHIETLEEIDMEYRELAEKSGIEHWRRVPALNTDERFIADMADMVIEALEAPVVSLSDSFLAQMSEDPASKVVQGLQLGAGVAPGVSGGVLTVPFGITEEGWSLNQPKVCTARAMYGVDVILSGDNKPLILEVQWAPDCAQAVVQNKYFWNEILGGLYLDEVAKFRQL